MEVSDSVMEEERKEGGGGGGRGAVKNLSCKQRRLITGPLPSSPSPSPSPSPPPPINAAAAAAEKESLSSLNRSEWDGQRETGHNSSEGGEERRRRRRRRRRKIIWEKPLLFRGGALKIHILAALSFSTMFFFSP